MQGGNQLTGGELRALVVTTLNNEPDATFDRVRAHLFSKQGRSLADAETTALREAYDAELANPTGVHRIGAVEAADIVRNQPFKLRPTEMVAAAFGLIPLVFHLQTTTASIVAKTTGAITAGSTYDLAATAGGFLALIVGGVAARQAQTSLSRRAMHLGLDAAILALGAFQVLLGLGVLQKMGLVGNP